MSCGEKELGKELKKGDRVYVRGLTGAPQYNGRFGTIEGERPNGRHLVVLDDGVTELGVKSANLQSVQKHLSASMEAAREAGNTLRMEEKDLTKSEVKELLRNVVIVQVPANWHTDMLDMRLEGGADRDVLVSTVQSVLHDFIDTTVGFVITNAADTTRKMLRKYDKECALCIKYIPAAKLAKPCCLREECLATLKSDQKLVWCHDCQMPRYCSERCEELDEAHKKLCSAIHNAPKNQEQFAKEFWDSSVQYSERSVCETNAANEKQMADYLDAVYERVRAACQESPDIRPLAKAFFETCSFCGNDGASLICGVCKAKRYCSGHCQKKDWATHKETCKLRQCRLNVNVGICLDPNTRPLPHDKNGKLLRLGLKATQTYLEAKQVCLWKVREGSERDRQQ